VRLFTLIDSRGRRGKEGGGIVFATRPREKVGRNCAGDRLPPPQFKKEETEEEKKKGEGKAHSFLSATLRGGKGKVETISFPEEKSRKRREERRKGVLFPISPA